MRHIRLPGNTLQIRGQAVCASIKGIPFEPCFNLDKKDERSFRGSVSGMGFAYCDFHHQGAAQMLMARAVARPRSLHPSEQTGSIDAPRAEVATRVETPQVEISKIEPVKSEPGEAGKRPGSASLDRVIPAGLDPSAVAWPLARRLLPGATSHDLPMTPRGAPMPYSYG